MYSEFLEEVVHFNNLSVSERKKRIRSELFKIGITPKEHFFSSCFGKGCNIWAEIGNKQKKVILSAHYDGKSIFDNNAGAFSLIGMARQILRSNYPFSVILLFSDCEETYQQGSAYFMREYHHLDIVKAINIDGFGIGDNLYTIQNLIKNINTDSDLFLTDKDEFVKNNIPSESYFTAFSLDFEIAKNTGLVYDTFKKYQSETFFRARFNEKQHVMFSKQICDIITK